MVSIRTRKRKRCVSTVILSLLIAMMFNHNGIASDHADPMTLRRLEAGITGLFVFPHDDQLILILGVRPALVQPAPYALNDLTFSIHMDLHTQITFDDEQDRLRYGGTIAQPEAISADITLRYQLNDDASLRSNTIDGLLRTENVDIQAGVYDDPFILPRFFGSNIIAIVTKIPFNDFPDGQQDWVIWGTSQKGGKQIDHVGRANRTMLPRFDLLNTLPPRDHVTALKARHENPGLLDDIKRVYISPLFAARPFDFVADVMIFTRRFSSGFPNGRLLTDDVAALTCQLGDCLLWETSFIDSPQWPRQTKNDKAFLSSFPFLASAWPDHVATPKPKLTARNRMLLIVIGLIIIVLIALPWILFVYQKHKLKMLQDGVSG